MKSSRALLSVLLVSTCAFALMVVAACSPAPSTSSSTSSAASSTASSSSKSQASSSASSSGVITADGMKAQGYQVFEGSIYVGNASDIIKAQAANIDPSVMSSDKGKYAILMFDAPVDVTGEQADGSGQTTRSAKVLGIAEYNDYGSFVMQYGDLAKCESLAGQHVMIAAKADKIMFPSDVRLPLNEPSASEIIFLQ